MIGKVLGHYEIVGKIGEGGPPPLARSNAQASYGEVPPKPRKSHNRAR